MEAFFVGGDKFAPENRTIEKIMLFKEITSDFSL